MRWDSRCRENKTLAHGHIASSWGSWNLNPGPSGSKTSDLSIRHAICRWGVTAQRILNLGRAWRGNLIHHCLKGSVPELLPGGPVFPSRQWGQAILLRLTALPWQFGLSPAHLFSAWQRRCGQLSGAWPGHWMLGCHSDARKKGGQKAPILVRGCGRCLSPTQLVLRPCCDPPWAGWGMGADGVVRTSSAGDGGRCPITHQPACVQTRNMPTSRTHAVIGTHLPMVHVCNICLPTNTCWS